jgi:hypothetical protein
VKLRLGDELRLAGEQQKCYFPWRKIDHVHDPERKKMKQDAALIEKCRKAWIDLVVECRLGKRPSIEKRRMCHRISLEILERQLHRTPEYYDMIMAADRAAWEQVEAVSKAQT